MFEQIQGKIISDIVLDQGFNESLTIYFVDGSRFEIDTWGEAIPQEPTNMSFKFISLSNEEEIIDPNDQRDVNEKR